MEKTINGVHKIGAVQNMFQMFGPNGTSMVPVNEYKLDRGVIVHGFGAGMSECTYVVVDDKMNAIALDPYYGNEDDTWVNTDWTRAVNLEDDKYLVGGYFSHRQKLQGNSVRPISEKFGIGFYFDESGEFMRGTAIEGEPPKSTFNYGSPFCHAPAMVRTEAYKAVGGYTVDPKLLRMEDYNLWMKMYAAGYRGYNLPEHLYMMRDDNNAIRRRTLRARLNGINAHWIAYKELNLSFFLFLRYAVGNIMMGVMPVWLYKILRKYAKR